jgi:hypothetical protein
MLYMIAPAMQPRMLVTLDEDLKPLPVSVRVGQLLYMLSVLFLLLEANPASPHAKVFCDWHADFVIAVMRQLTQQMRKHDTALAVPRRRVISVMRPRSACRMNSDQRGCS